MKNSISILCLLVILGSCSTVKRNGYYQTKRYKVGKQSVLNLKSKSPKKKKRDDFHLPIRTTVAKLHTPESDLSKIQIEPTNKFQTYTSKRPSLYHGSQSLIKTSNETQTDSCDNIIMKNGDEIAAIVTEVGPYEIRYKKCSYLDGPIYVIEKSKVHMVQYQNGSRDLFTTDQIVEDANTSHSTYNSDETSGGKVIGWLFMIIGFLFLLFLSILFGAAIMLVALIILIGS